MNILRLNIIATATGVARWSHDPSNASGLDPADIMRIDVPFRIVD